MTICSYPDCTTSLRAFEQAGGNELCTPHRLMMIMEEKKRKRMTKAKFMSDEERKTFLTPDELKEFDEPVQENKLSW